MYHNHELLRRDAANRMHDLREQAARQRLLKASRVHWRERAAQFLVRVAQRLEPTVATDGRRIAGA